jgi:hypothetical protein
MAAATGENIASIPGNVALSAASPRAESFSSVDKKDFLDSRASTTAIDDLADETQTRRRLIDIILRRKNAIDLDAVATVRSVYDDPKLAPHYQPTPQYENLARFDPKARWTYREETVSDSIFVICLYLHRDVPRLFCAKLTGRSCSGRQLVFLLLISTGTI